MAAASSPETISSETGSGSCSAPSAAAAQASATPRAFGVAGRWKAPQPGFSSKPSAWASSASRSPPPPPRPDQTSTARSDDRSRSVNACGSWPSATRSTVAPLRRACVIHRSTIGARSVTASSPSTQTSSAPRSSRAARGRRRGRSSTCSAFSASARTAGIGRCLVAGDDQEADRLGVRLVPVRCRGPRLGYSAAVRRRGQIESRAAGLALEAERVRELSEAGAAATRASRPDQHGAVGATQPLLELGVGLRLRQLDDLGSVSACLLDPQLDDRGAVGDALLADHDDELRVRDRGERGTKGVERRGGCLWQNGGVGAEPGAEEPAERVGLLDRLGARERGHDPAARRRGAAPRPDRARRPRRAR